MVYPELFPGTVHALALPMVSHHPGGTPLTRYPPLSVRSVTTDSPDSCHQCFQIRYCPPHF